MNLNAIAGKLKRQAKDNFKGRHFEAWLIARAVTWYLRYPLGYRDLEDFVTSRPIDSNNSLNCMSKSRKKRLTSFGGPVANFLA